MVPAGEPDGGAVKLPRLSVPTGVKVRPEVLPVESSRFSAAEGVSPEVVREAPTLVASLIMVIVPAESGAAAVIARKAAIGRLDTTIANFPFFISSSIRLVKS